MVNQDYEKGMLTSLQAGIRALASDVGAAMFTLVDHPAVEESTLDRLIEQLPGPVGTAAGDSLLWAADGDIPS